MKSKFESYYLNNIAKGCKYCIKGKKLVLFVSGICSRNCYYCSLSEKRKNKDIIYLNERVLKNTKDILSEVRESNSKGAGITGGDPFLYMARVIKYSKLLKTKFGKKFHIHIYLPTKLLTLEKLKKLSGTIDEVRFHPEFLINDSIDIIKKDISKIKLARKYYKKQNIGIELPMIPEKKKEILDFILKITPYISFVNLNELELSETNFNIMTKNYKFNDTGYVIKSSKKAGLWLIEQLKLKKSKLKVHFCTADLKNNFQYKNRLKIHKILPYGKKTKDGTVKYLVTDLKNKKFLQTNKYFIDKKKIRIILSENLAKNLLVKTKMNVTLVEEFPTFDSIEVETQKISL